MKKLVIALLVLAAPLVLLGAREEEKAKHDGPTNAVAVIHGFGDNPVKGAIHFKATTDGVQISGQLSGLKPGKHGFHIHEFGDVTSADGMATGGHFNPDMHKHGGPDDKERHAGDFGNIEAGADGKATIKMTDKAISLSGPSTILGRALIVHAKEDDLKTQPSGNAGDRIGQGVIGVAK